MERVSLIAVCNSSTDVRVLLRDALEAAGFQTASGHVPEIKLGQHDFIAFIAEHKPEVIVYDIGPPYEENWTFFQLVTNTRVTSGIPFVVTTTNKRALEAIVGETPAIELIGQQEDLAAIVEAVRAALAAQPEPA